MIYTEFFKSLREAESYADRVGYPTDVYGLDKRGTAKKFREWRDDAIALARYNEAEDAVAVVLIYKY
jgi:hypothetical protein